MDGAERIDPAAQTLARAEQLYVRGDFAEAAPLYVQSAALRGARSANPYFKALAHFRLGMIAAKTLQGDEAAIRHFRKAVLGRASLPAHAKVRHAAYLNLGNALRRLGRYAEALDCFQQALEIKPDAQTLLGMARIHRKLGDGEQATDAIRRALLLEPENFEARLFDCMARLPTMPHTSAEVDASRASYGAALQALARDVEAACEAQRRLWAEAVGSVQPFYLAYLNRNERDLQQVYGAMLHRLMAARCPAHVAPLSPRRRAPGERIRVGFVSRFLASTKAVWRIPTQGWVAELDRDGFEVIGYCTDETRRIDEASAHGFCRLRQGLVTAEAWARQIAADAPDLLVYPEFGMDPMALALGALRLAPVQLAAWGHAMTSGLPTIDGFLSCDAMEAATGQEHYTEPLIRLPGLSTCYTPPAPPEIARSLTRAELGVEEDAPLFLCSQAIFKYHPDHDDLFPRIAEAVPHARFLFLPRFRNQALKVFEARLQQVFARHGLQAQDYCRFFPCEKGDYYAAHALADIYLDTLGWSGCNTAFDAIDQGMPIVTRAGSHMRSRMAMALLRLMGVEETIAADDASYVAIAARLAHAPAEREALGARLLAGRRRLYGDRAPVRALEDVFRSLLDARAP